MMEALEKCQSCEEICLHLIIEFLESLEFKRSLEELLREMSTCGISIPENQDRKPRIKKENVPIILSLMKSLDPVAFFKGWATLVPSEIQLTAEYRKLTLLLYVFFATLSQRELEGRTYAKQMEDKEEKSEDSNKESEEEKSVDIEMDKDSLDIEVISLDDKKIDEPSSVEKSVSFIESERNQDASSGNTAMVMFRNFLDSRGSELSSEPDFLPFFALPYVTSPRDHPTFSQVFQESWVKDLESMLLHFLVEYSCGDLVIPELMKICATSKDEEAKRGITHLRQQEDYLQRYKEMKRKFHKLRRDHHNIVGVASELATALENSVRGEAVDLRSTLENCTNIFPDLFNKSSGSSILRKEVIKQKQHINCNELDVNKIKRELKSGTIKSKLLLLQALRWCITERRGDEREAAVCWMSRHDLLGLDTEMMKADLTPEELPQPVQQATSRLINALASLRTGRDYLISSTNFISLLTLACLRSYSGDPITHDMLLASLQKLSLRKEACQIMLKSQLVNWLLEKLEGESFSGYSLEYSTSLLMNLCLHIEVSYWDTQCQPIVSIVLKLLNIHHKYVLEFVCGTLYCLLRNDPINMEFQKCNLEEVLVDKLKNDINDDPVAEKQITTLIGLHRREIPPEAVAIHADDSVEEDLDDPDELEPEIELGDLVPNTLNGDRLLALNYRLIFPARGIVDRVKRVTENQVSLRPSTPRSIQYTDVHQTSRAMDMKR